MQRRTLLKSPLLALGSFAGMSAFAQSANNFPTRPIIWIVPYAPGGSTDTIARILSSEMQKAFPQPIVVDYKPGAATTIGANFVSRAAPDGYTLMSADNGTLAYNQFIYPSLPYDANTSFSYVGGIGRFPMALAVAPSVPVKTAQEFLAWAKANRGRIFYGSPGIGSPHHLNMEFFLDAVGVSLQHTPYKGGAPAINALVAGEIQAMIVDLGL
ncbi:MAG: tripartite tricarboxylate transporter substrate binding protein, partial [Gallionellaceae bacterium]|nr:tripartite tricarboxylate transporter substrate binding protein [Gallionellaceae bacterium]